MKFDPAPWIGLPWPEAEPLLTAYSLRMQTVVTRPPGRPQGCGELRVVGMRDQGAMLLVVLAHRDYCSGDRPGSTHRTGDVSHG